MNDRAHNSLRRAITPTVSVSRVRALMAALFVVALVALGVSSGTVSAENQVVNSSPAESASVTQSPDEIVIGFTEELGDANTIAMVCGVDDIVLDPAEVGDDGTTLTAKVPEPLPAGNCTARWAVSNADGEANGSGTFNFIVENDPTASTPLTDEPADATPTTVITDADSTVTLSADSDPEVIDLSIAGRGHAAVWLGRLISTLGIATLFGSLLVIAAAWPEGVEYLVTIKFLRGVWVIALLGTLLFVSTASGIVTPDGGGSGFSPGTWLDLIDAGWAGRAALLRLVLLLASAWVAFRPDRAIDPTTQLAALGVPGLCAAMLGISRTIGDLAAVGVLLGIVHALAMSVWIGGVILLARVVLSGPGEEDLIHAVRGFGRVSTPAIAITIVTGVLQMLRLDGGELFSTGHGRIVVLKAVVVAVMIFVAISARQFVAQRLNRAQQMSVPLADRLRRAFGAEAGIGIVTLALSAWLLAFVPANVNTAPTIDYDVRQEHTVDAADFEAVVQFTDNQIGLVGLEVEIKRPTEGLSNLVLILTAPPNDVPNLGSIRQPIPLDGRGFAVRDEAVIGLPISVAGNWTVHFEAITAAGAVSTPPQTYAVLDADGNAPSSQATTPPTSLVETQLATDPVATAGEA